MRTKQSKTESPAAVGSTPLLGRPGTQLAKILLKQIEEENPQCAFWLVSAVCKLLQENPQMNMVCFLNILASEIPKACSSYQEYVRSPNTQVSDGSQPPLTLN